MINRGEKTKDSVAQSAKWRVALFDATPRNITFSRDIDFFNRKQGESVSGEETILISNFFECGNNSKNVAYHSIPYKVIFPCSKQKRMEIESCLNNLTAEKSSADTSGKVDYNVPSFRVVKVDYNVPSFRVVVLFDEKKRMDNFNGKGVIDIKIQNLEAVANTASYIKRDGCDFSFRSSFGTVHHLKFISGTQNVLVESIPPEGMCCKPQIEEWSLCDAVYTILCGTVSSIVSRESGIDDNELIDEFTVFIQKSLMQFQEDDERQNLFWNVRPIDRISGGTARSSLAAEIGKLLKQECINAASKQAESLSMGTAARHKITEVGYREGLPDSDRLSIDVLSRYIKKASSVISRMFDLGVFDSFPWNEGYEKRCTLYALYWNFFPDEIMNHLPPAKLQQKNNEEKNGVSPVFGAFSLYNHGWQNNVREPLTNQKNLRFAQELDMYSKAMAHAAKVMETFCVPVEDTGFTPFALSDVIGEEWTEALASMIVRTHFLASMHTDGKKITNNFVSQTVALFEAPFYHTDIIVPFTSDKSEWNDFFDDFFNVLGRAVLTCPKENARWVFPMSRHVANEDISAMKRDLDYSFVSMEMAERIRDFCNRAAKEIGNGALHRNDSADMNGYMAF